MPTNPVPETFEQLLRRFPVLDVIIKNLSFGDSDRKLLRDLFLEVFCGGYEDGKRQFA